MKLWRCKSCGQVWSPVDDRKPTDCMNCGARGRQIERATGSVIARGPAQVYSRPLDPRQGNEFEHVGEALSFTVTKVPLQSITPRAADRWALVDEDDTDFPSLKEMGMPDLFPDRPGDVCADLTATAQLYWPGGMPWDPHQLGGELESGAVIRVDGDALCPDCGSPYYVHPLAPWPLDYNRERFLRRLCDGNLGKT